MGKIYFSVAEFYGHSGQIILKRVLQHCSGVQKEFPGYSTSPAGNSSKILVAVPSRKSSFTFPGLQLWGKNSKTKKEKILSGLCKQISPMSNGFFPGKGSKYVQEFERFLEERDYTRKIPRHAGKRNIWTRESLILDVCARSRAEKLTSFCISVMFAIT